MSTPRNFFGYPGQVWQAVYQTLNWLSGQLGNGTAPAVQQASATSVVFSTMINALFNVQAWQAGQALTAEVQNLIAVEALPISLSPTVQAYFNARVAAYTVAASGIVALPKPVTVTNIPALLSAGTPAIADPAYLEWCMGFSGETAPSGFTGPALPSFAATAATSWQTVATTVAAYQGINQTPAYDTAARLARSAGVVSGIVNALKSGGFAAAPSPATLWSQCVALPSMLLDASLLSSTPNLLQNQQCGVIKYAVVNIAITLAQFLLSLRQPSLAQVSQAQVRANETLMDIAARSLGNFEQWYAIATLNGLVPPYPGADNSTLVGQQLLLPSSTGAPVIGAAVPSYAANVLGIDYDFGPINGVQPVWTGDYRLITGLLNFARSLGRRLQTPTGALIYHPAYGSRIPPEVGAIQTADEAARLVQYGVAALQADPRTGTVSQPSATLSPGFLASFQAVVTPIGPGAQPVSVNETIGALP